MHTNHFLTVWVAALMLQFVDCNAQVPSDTCYEINHSRAITANSDAAILLLDSHGLFGMGVCELGDLNGDGQIEIGVGSPRGGQDDDGKFYILSLDTAGQVVNAVTIGSNTPILSNKLDSLDEFGRNACMINDLDGNGVNDLLVCAPYDDDSTTNAGAVYALFMSQSLQVTGIQKISNSDGNLTASLQPSGRFGSSVTYLGDLNSDGRPEIAVGQALANAGNTQSGRVWILSLNTDGTVFNAHPISMTEGGFNQTIGPGSRFGQALAAVGDLNYDGIMELAIGAGRAKVNGFNNIGVVYIISVDSNLQCYAVDSLVPGQLFLPALDSDGMNFGASLGHLGDWDKDGRTELLVGAWTQSISGSSDGGGYIIDLGTGFQGLLSTEVSQLTHPMLGLTHNDQFGRGLAAIGDYNGDGFVDFAVGARGVDAGEENSGAVFLFQTKGEPCGGVGVNELAHPPRLQVQHMQHGWKIIAPVNTPFRYELYDVHGQLLESQSTDAGEVELPGAPYARGVYLLKAMAGDAVWTAKILRW